MNALLTHKIIAKRLMPGESYFALAPVSGPPGAVAYLVVSQETFDAAEVGQEVKIEVFLLPK